MSTKYIRLNSTSLTIFLILSLTFLIINCGGGGGGSGESDIANSELTVEPSTLEVGGIQKITIKLSDVQENLSIKLRYPVALQYISGSAVFVNGADHVVTNPAFDLPETPTASPSSSTTSGSSSSVAATPTPTATPTATSSGSNGSKTTISYEKQYLVFFITKDAFGSEPSGTLTLNLRAKNVQEGGRVEMDVDLDDPSIANNREFSVSDPLFDSEQASDVRIRN